MINQLRIRGFRGFQELEVARLARVNLFVGPNNSGKTSLLEAVEILAMGSARALTLGPTRRRELVVASSEGGLPVARSWVSEEEQSVGFLGADERDGPALGVLWDSVVLTPEEEAVVGAIRIIEPRVERLALIQGRGPLFVLKLAGERERIPLGSAGDGLRRFLLLTLHLAAARNGILLIDEIDTGLYHSTMADMWKLVVETARRLDVQVFATTHSLDCVRALAWLLNRLPGAEEEVLLHRVERGFPETTLYSLEEVATAAERHLEVR